MKVLLVNGSLHAKGCTYTALCEVEKALQADRKEIDKAFKQLKEEGKIVSPVRCKWEPAQ